MTQRDSPAESGDATGTLTSPGRGYVSKLRRYARRVTRSGALAGAGGTASLLGGVRALRRGERGRGLVRVFVGGLLVTLAAGQRRRRREASVDQTDVVDTSLDVEDAATGTGAETGPRATGDEASEVARSSVDVEAAIREGGATDEESTDGTPDETPEAAATDEESTFDEAELTEEALGQESAVEEPLDESLAESETDAEEADEVASGEADEVSEEADEEASAATDEMSEETGEAAPGEAPLPGESTGEEAAETTDEEAEEFTLSLDEAELERLGEAAFDEQSGRVPAPQQAFNVELLSLGAEAFWGIREADDTVLVTQNYDALQDWEDVRYVASSEVDDEDREVRIPDTVLNHWDDVADGGTAVESGTGIVFVTVEDLSEDGLLLVVPEQWAEDLLGGDEE